MLWKGARVRTKVEVVTEELDGEQHIPKDAIGVVDDIDGDGNLLVFFDGYRWGQTMQWQELTLTQRVR